MVISAGGFEVRSHKPGVHPLAHRRVDDTHRLADARRVQVGQVGESDGIAFGRRRAEQWGQPGEVDVVADQHRLAHAKRRVHAAGRVGENHRGASRGHCGPYTVNHFGRWMSLIEMDPARHHQHAPIGHVYRTERASVAGHRRRMETGDGFGGHRGINGAQTLGNLGPARAQYHRSVEVAPQLLNELGSGLLSSLEWVHVLMVGGAGDTSRTTIEGRR